MDSGRHPRIIRVYAPSDSSVRSSTNVSNLSPTARGIRAGNDSSHGSASRSGVTWYESISTSPAGGA
ncbi:hypothetical protein [Streptomyces sp. NPDC088847]|uniref:hypothetical protein n=1 Tax=Streptomyces sp. NPDC088847 TaxID=3365909 RepID=UPI00382140DE